MPYKKNKRWIRKHLDDPYYRRAKKSNVPSRSAFKIEQIQKLTRLFRPGQKIIDLCCAPGGWLKVIQRIVGEDGLILGVDTQTIRPQERIEFLQADILAPDFHSRIPSHFQENVDVVVSDCSPKTTGVKNLDQYRQIELAEAAWRLSLETLKPGGVFLTKIFQSREADEFIEKVKFHTSRIRLIKPPASRKTSKEMYLIAWMKRPKR